MDIVSNNGCLCMEGLLRFLEGSSSIKEGPHHSPHILELQPFLKRDSPADCLKVWLLAAAGALNCVI